MRIELFDGDKAVNERLGDIKRVYSRALAPLTTVDPDAFEAILRRHVTRAGFRSVQATTKPATLVGFGYGYRSEPGQWWHDTVAPLLGEARLSDWLTDAFELVELHVLPEWQGRGIGRRIHNMLLADIDLRRAVLSVYEDNKRAIRFYEATGWQTLRAGVKLGGRTRRYQILGRQIDRRPVVERS